MTNRKRGWQHGLISNHLQHHNFLIRDRQSIHMSATMFTRSSQVSSPPPSPRIKTSPQSRSSSTDSSSSTPTSPITLPSHPHIQRSTPLLLSHALLLFLLGIPVNILLLFGCILRLVGLEKLSWGLGCWVAKSLWGWLQDHLEGKGIGGGGFGLGAGEVMTFSGDLGEVKEGEGAVVIAVSSKLLPKILLLTGRYRCQ